MARLSRKAEHEIIKQVQAAISEGTSHCVAKHDRWSENQKYASNEQWSKADIYRQEQRERPAVPWNDTFRAVNAIANREVVSRLVPKVFGRSREDAGVAGVLDEACRWQRQTALSEHYESMAFRSAIVSGYGCAHKFWDPSAQDGRGQIRDEDVPLCEMLWPARSREMNLSDRRWHIRGRWVTVEEADEMWGSSNRKVRNALRGAKARADGAIPDTSANQGDKMNRARGGHSWGWEYVRHGKYLSLASDEVFVIEYEWNEVEYVWKAAVPVKFFDWIAFINGGQPIEVENTDPATGQVQKIPLVREAFDMLPQEQKDNIRDMVLAEDQEVEFDSYKEFSDFEDIYYQTIGQEFQYFSKVGKRVVKFAIVINNAVAETGVRPYGWSYYFITGFPVETSEGMDYIGAVDIVKGRQDYKNALMSNALAMYMASPKGTLMVEKSAVGNIDEFRDQFASIGGVVEVQDGFFQRQQFQFAPQPSFPPMMEQLFALTGGGVEELLGLSAIGTQEDLRRISGKVVQAAELAQNTVIAVPFDAMRMFRKQYGLCNVKFLTYMYTPDELIRIVGPDKAEDVNSDDSAWGDIIRYDVSIDEQPSSPTEQMEVMDFLTRTGELSQMRMRGDIDFEGQLLLMPHIPESTKRLLLKGKTMAEQKAAVEAQNMELQQTVQMMWQYLGQIPNGEQILNGFVMMWQNAQASQQIFSQQGVPQAPPRQAQPAPMQ